MSGGGCGGPLLRATQAVPLRRGLAAPRTI